MADFIEVTTGTFVNVDYISAFDDLSVEFHSGKKVYRTNVLPGFQAWLERKAAQNRGEVPVMLHG